MKKLFTLTLLGALTLPAFAQTQKGQTITSGTVGLSIDNTKTAGQDPTRSVLYTNKYTFTELRLNRGKFIRDNWLLGASLAGRYDWNGQENSLNTPSSFRTATNETINSSAGVYIRRYWPVVERLSVYVGGGLATDRSEQLSSSLMNGQPSLNRSRTISWEIAPTFQVGGLYALTERIGVEASITGNGFPVGVGTANFGVAILGGRSRSGPTLAADNFVTAQTNQGRWLLGTSASINGTSNTVDPTGNQADRALQARVEASLSAGRFVKDNLLVGIGVDLSVYRNSSTYNTASATTYLLTFSPFVRSYLGTSRLRPYVELGGHYGYENVVSNEFLRYAGLSASTGLACMVGNRFIVQTELISVNGTYQWLPFLPDVTSNTLRLGVRATTLSNISVAYSL
ncbi:hypothetical protein [Fibrella arboris]|uniref:hypothetical protein n=1 Tax=Fibrella arboris TaxID=3242486 RepID=UPI0035225EA6